VTVNHARQTDFAAEVAGQVAGPDKVDTDTPPLMGAEDFSFMLEARPGASSSSAMAARPACITQVRLQRQGDPRRHLLLGTPRRDGHAGLEQDRFRWNRIGSIATWRLKRESALRHMLKSKIHVP